MQAQLPPSRPCHKNPVQCVLDQRRLMLGYDYSDKRCYRSSEPQRPDTLSRRENQLALPRNPRIPEIAEIPHKPTLALFDEIAHGARQRLLQDAPIAVPIRV